MSTAEAHNQTRENLETALAADLFPPHVKKRAEGLRDRLDAPTRITLFGMPRVGKTGVLNLLAGDTLIPDDIDLGTIRVRHGVEEKTRVTLNDGETLEMPGLPDRERLAQLYPVLTHVEAPMPALTKISLMELGQVAEPGGQARAIEWAVKRTEIGLWCTDTFTEVEARLWEVVPDRLRHHSLILVTRSDLLGLQRDAVVEQMLDRVGTSFAHTLGVSAQEAQSASTDGQIDAEIMRASGGTKLISTLLNEIEKVRQPAVDQADILLKMHEASGPSAIKDERPSALKPAINETPEQTAVASHDVDAGSMPEAVVIAFSAATDRLSSVGVDLTRTETPEASSVVKASANALSWLTQYLEEADLPETPVVAQARAMTQNAVDLVQLLQIEEAEDASIEAALAMLQLKRGFQAALAA